MKKGLKSVPSQVQLPGGVILKGLTFKIIAYNADGSPKTFELLPSGVVGDPNDPTSCVLYAYETWIRQPVPGKVPPQ